MDVNGMQIASAAGVAAMLLVVIHRLVIADLPRRGTLWMLLLWGLIVVVVTAVILLLQPATS